MRNEYSNTERLAVLLELGLNYHEKLNKAMDKKDVEIALKCSELIECIAKVMEDIETRG